jgi:hypothetical protein
MTAPGYVALDQESVESVMNGSGELASRLATEEKSPVTKQQLIEQVAEELLECRSLRLRNTSVEY